MSQQRLNTTPTVYVDVHNERWRAHEYHSILSHGSMEEKPWDHPVWLPVLVEELGEVARVLCEAEGDPEGMPVRVLLRQELVQVAAMACAWIAAIDASDEGGDDERTTSTRPDTN